MKKLFIPVIVGLSILTYSCKKEDSNSNEIKGSGFTGKFAVDSIAVEMEIGISSVRHLTRSWGDNMQFNNNGTVNIKFPMSGVDTTVNFTYSNNIITSDLSLGGVAVPFVVTKNNNQARLEHQDTTFIHTFFLREI